MLKRYYKEIYLKYKNRSLTPLESEEWEKFVSDPANEIWLQEFLNSDWEELKSEQTWIRIPENREKVLLEQLLWIITAKTRSTIFEMKKLLAAAAILIAVLFSWLFFLKNESVEPGKNQAYLLMSDGNKIELNSSNTGIAFTEGNVKYIDGKQLVKNENIELNGTLSLVTPIGGQYQLLLEDGSHVWLNADSRISYPVRFHPNRPREVKIEGEVYFEVKHDNNRAFIVHTDEQQVQVLGTQFSVSSYKNDPFTTTTLLSGSVALTAAGKNLVLKPNQQAVLQNNKVSVQQLIASDALSWTKGEFVLNNEPLESIMRKLARWYNIEVFFEQEEIRQLQFQGVLNRFDQIDDIFELLEKIGDVRFKRIDRKVYVSLKK